LLSFFSLIVPKCDSKRTTKFVAVKLNLKGFVAP
jgi:hypothetical protein